MNVKQLIEKLQALPPHLHVQVGELREEAVICERRASRKMSGTVSYCYIGRGNQAESDVPSQGDSEAG